MREVYDGPQNGHGRRAPMVLKSKSSGVTTDAIGSFNDGFFRGNVSTGDWVPQSTAYSLTTALQQG